MNILKRIIRMLRYKMDPIAQVKREGVKVGSRCRLVGDVSFGSEPYLITLGDHVSITSSSFITHDGGVWVMRDEHETIDVVAPISVGSNVFIGAGCLILPGVTIGDDVVVGAGAIVTKDLESRGVYAGVPAKKVKDIDDYIKDSISKGVPTKGMGAEEKRTWLLKKINIENR